MAKASARAVAKPSEKRSSPRLKEVEKKAVAAAKKRAASPAPKKVVAKKAVAKKPAAKKAAPKKKGGKHPTYFLMIRKAFRDLGGPLSGPAIEKYVVANYRVDEEKAHKSLRLALKRAVDEDGTLAKVRASYKLTSRGKAIGKKRRVYAKRAVPAPEKAKKAAPKKKEKKDEKAAPKKKEKKDEKEKPESKKRAANEKASPAKKAKKAIKEVAPKKASSKKAPNKVAAAKPKAVDKGKRRVNGPVPEDKEAPVVDVHLPKVTTSGVAFNTTDLPHIRDDIKNAIATLLQDDNVRVAIIANRGWKGDDNKYNLELLEFSDDVKQINDFIENSYGEGANWLEYYRQVLESAINLAWGTNRNKMLILIGDAGTQALMDPSLQQLVGRLNTLGVKVFGFHHSQLVLLDTVLSDLN